MVATAGLAAVLMPTGATATVLPVAGDVRPERTSVSVVSNLKLGGFNAAVDVHGRYAYVSSFGQPLPPPPPGQTPLPGDPLRFCPTLGIKVVDLADPRHPKLVGRFANKAKEPDIAGTWNETVAVQTVRTSSFRGTLAAVPFFSCGGPKTFEGFGLYDVSNPRRVKRLALVRLPNPVFGMQVLTLEARGNKAYVYTASSMNEVATSKDAQFGTDPKTWRTPGTQADMMIFDVSKPKVPRKISQWGAWKNLGLKPVRDDANGIRRAGFVHTVRVENKVAYLSYFDNGTVMLDVRNPARPRYLGRTYFLKNEAGNAVFSANAKGGRVLIETDEHTQNDALFGPYLTGPYERAWGYTRLYDISNPKKPKRISRIETPLTRQFPPPADGIFYTPHWPRVQGDKLFLSYHSEGLVVADIANPYRPRITGTWLPPKAVDPFGFFAPGKAFRYVWGLDLYRNYLVAIDINGGLFVLKARS